MDGPIDHSLTRAHLRSQPCGARGGPPRGSGSRWSAAAAVALAVALASGPAACRAGSSDGASGERAGKLDVPYEPTPPEVVDAMLALAEVGEGDVVYDLGCGDGRIVVAAARAGARGVGVDLDPQRIREARVNAIAAGVADRVELRVGDLFETDVSPATVVMLFLWPEVNLRLRPRLLAQLRPGARVVSHWHDMGDWKPSRTIQVAGRNVHLWIVPERRVNVTPLAPAERGRGPGRGG